MAVGPRNRNRRGAGQGPTQPVTVLGSVKHTVRRRVARGLQRTPGNYQGTGLRIG